MAKRKRPASEATVWAFLEAVYPGHADLAALAFDEEAVLTEATRQLRANHQEARHNASCCGGAGVVPNPEPNVYPPLVPCPKGCVAWSS